MRFTNFFTSTLALASLALAAAVPDPANPELVERSPVKPPAHAAPLIAGTGIFKDIKATKAAWQGVAAACGSRKKRGLESRTPPKYFTVVPQGGHAGSGQYPISYYTEGLITCFGIVIKGTAPASNPNANTRWLLHMHATESMDDWAKFKKDVEASGITSMTGYMSLPSPAPVGMDINGRPWTQEQQDLSNRVMEKTKAAVRDFTKRAPVIHMRPMLPASSMQVSGEGKVRAGGTEL